MSEVKDTTVAQCGFCEHCRHDGPMKGQLGKPFQRHRICLESTDLDTGGALQNRSMRSWLIWKRKNEYCSAFCEGNSFEEGEKKRMIFGQVVLGRESSQAEIGLASSGLGTGA